MMYTKKSFAHCQFNPMTEQKMLDAYQDLYYVFSGVSDELVRFIIMVYDPKSPLVTNERDVNKRKELAAALAKYDQEEESPKQADIVTAYLRFFPRSKEWAAICALEFKFWESIKKLMQPIKPGKDTEELMAVEKKAKISDEIEKDIRRLETYHRAFYGDDEVMVKKASRITPEQIAGL